MRKPAILAAIVFAAFGTANAQTPEIHISKDNRTISITTSADSSAAPDIAVVHIGFTVYAVDQQSAYASGSQRSNAIFDSLMQAGVAKKDIEGENQIIASIQPHENNNLPEKQKTERKFQVSQSWTVKIGAEDAAKILDIAIQAGANNSGNIEWQVKDEDALQSQAAANALKSARTVATAMAAGLGVKLGALIYASNEVPEAGGVMGGSFAPEAKVQRHAVKPLAIAPRKVKKSAAVTAVFAIE